MTTRTDTIEAFLRRTGWNATERLPLAGDASLRRYVRLIGGSRPALLMDAPPGTGEDVRPFLHVAGLLAERGLSVPEILAADADAGLLVIEDMGTRMFATVARDGTDAEVEIYVAAAEALAHLQRAPAPTDLPAYGPLMADLAGLSLDWYATGNRHLRPDLVRAMEDALRHPALQPPVFVHRDFHADNLIWLPERTGPARVGMLDFQDAMLGPADYDLASLIHDPRRPVSDAARIAATDAYVAASGRPRADVDAGLAIASAQRCLRILGVFARLCLRDGKRHYPDFIPRTWAALTRDLEHPALHDLAAIVSAALPAPTPERLDDIRARAGTLTGRPHAAEPA